MNNSRSYLDHCEWLSYRKLGNFYLRNNLKIIFIGNSRIRWNYDSYTNDIPGIITKLALFNNINIDSFVFYSGQTTLEQHWHNPDIHNLIKSDWFDFIIFHEYGIREASEIEWSLYLEYASKFIQLTQGQIIPILLTTWGFQNDTHIPDKLSAKAKTIASYNSNIYTEIFDTGKFLKNFYKLNNIFYDISHLNIDSMYFLCCLFHYFLHKQPILNTVNSFETEIGMRIDMDIDKMKFLEKLAWMEYNNI